MNRPATPMFSAELEASGDPAVIRVSGEFDLTKVDYFDKVAASVPDTASVIVDLAEASLVDSAGLGAILRLRRDQLTAGGSLLVRAPRPFQQKLFEITGLEYLLESDG